MLAFHPTTERTPSSRSDTQSLFLGTLRHHISSLESGKVRVRVSKTRRLFERLPGMAYHFKPELFLQIAGTTDFTFPDERFALEPGEICVMPRGVPHGEAARDDQSRFENMVVCYYNDTVAIHVAHALPSGRPIVDDIFFYSTPLYPSLVEYLNRIGELRLNQDAASRTAIKGLLLAELALLQSIVETQESGLFSETERVFRCQWLVRNNLADPELGVDALAAELRCSASHLSRLFHHATGERIVEYITRIRLNNALEAIRNTPLSIKEIAVACGFNDPNYFTRVFRQHTGRSPKQYRTDHQGVACSIEKEPKVVYYDHEENDFGLRPDVMAKAVTRIVR
jgi:AraC-like DNA-binding protein